MTLVPARKFPPLITMDEVEERELRWLWHPYIPIGKATMLYGQGGIGKSHIAVDIAARVSTGSAFPGQDEGRVPANVLILNAEDDYHDTLKPRLRLAGADMSRIFVPQSEYFVLDIPGIKQLEEYMREMAATIVFIDPVAFYLGGKVDINRVNEVRGFTGALNKAARNSGTAIVIIHHIKKGDSNDYNRALGSVDFPNAMRSTLFVTKTNDGTRVMTQPKNNNAKEGRPIAFAFNDSKFEWLGEYDDDSALVPVGRPRANATAFIKDLLQHGPVTATEVDVAAGDAGLNPRTLARAKNGLAESYAKRIDGKLVWYWRLIGDKRAPVISEDFLNTNAERSEHETPDPAPVPSVEKRQSASSLGRKPSDTGNGPVDRGEAKGPVGPSSSLALGRPDERVRAGTDPLSTPLGVAGLSAAAIKQLRRKS